MKQNYQNIKMKIMAKFSHRNNLKKIKDAREARNHVRFIDEEAIIEAYEKVSKIFPVKIEDIKSLSRKREVVNARNTLMWVCYYVLNHSQNQIGEFLGNRKHSTVSVMCDSVEDWYDTEKPYRDALDDILFVQYNQPRITQEVTL